MAMRLIIADNEPLQRAFIKDLLIRQGYLIVGEASNGWNTVKLAREQRPDAVITNIAMSDMDGIVVAEILKQEKIAPVILLTVLSNPQLVKRAKDAGVASYLIKPMHESELVFAIERSQDSYNQFRALQEENRVLIEELELRRIAERAKGLEMEKSLLWQDRTSNLQIKSDEKAFIANEVKNILSDIEVLKRGSLVLGASLTLELSFLTKLGDQYQVLYPEISISYVVAPDNELAANILAKEIDLAFVQESTFYPGIFNYAWHNQRRKVYIMRAAQVQLSRSAHIFLRLLLQNEELL